MFAFLSRIFGRKKDIITAVAITAVSVATPFIAKEEGKSNLAYKDIVGVYTICYGHTKDVKPGDHKTDKECENLLRKEVEEFAHAVNDLAIVPLPIEMHAAFTSLTYNIGVGAFRKSTLLQKLNASNYRGACDEILKWNKAGGKVVSGLVNRREREHQLCLAGLSAIS